ncbi:catalase [Dysgonomonas sp. PH5-45]|uniref:catalase n=1 Tax=unclassified Dysgonomonas TaxID=2630389 RepID=UPI002474BEE1|nr:MULTISPECIES: catalase [unclassified Dysgonomonas]MDH6354549.1 catalase [Dysgonomonas sp. PH5-45]MDH6387395.1 catalase [Dysgonomonas sp. PH5-37]
MKENKKRMTTNQGIPVDNDQASITTQKEHLTLLSDTHLVEKLAHFDRERIPERVVHAKGSGAHGYFEVTNDVSKYTCASFLSEVGKKTEIVARFSTVGGGRGSADSARDPRGFAVKFYTEDGNYDMVGNNTPVFFIRDAIKFPDFIHTQKKNPMSNLDDADAFWDFLSLTPESVHQVTILFSDRGTPYSFRHMHGYTSHAYMWYNEKGEHFWIKLHFRTNQGIKNLTRQEATTLAGTDPDHATRDLHDSIARKEFPSWDVFVQIMPPQEAERYGFDAFDVTKVWSQKDYPLIPVGKMVLDHNPDNYFSEIEQAAFSPGNLVPGIAISPDKMLQGRVFSYPDTHRHRLGTNFDMIPVNAPKAQVNTYQRDGAMNMHSYGGPNYYPNSFDGPAPDKKYATPPVDVAGIAARHEYQLTDMDYVQAGDLYGRVLSNYDKTNLIDNIVSHIKNAAPRIQLRQSAIFYKAHPEYGTRVAQGLGLDINEVKRLAAISQDERVKATAL